MSFLLIAALFAAAAFGGATIGDPTFRPDRDLGHWQTTTTHANVNIGDSHE